MNMDNLMRMKMRLYLESRRKYNDEELEVAQVQINNFGGERCKSLNERDWRDYIERLERIKILEEEIKILNKNIRNLNEDLEIAKEHIRLSWRNKKLREIEETIDSSESSHSSPIKWLNNYNNKR